MFCGWHDSDLILVKYYMGTRSMIPELGLMHLHGKPDSRDTERGGR